VRTWIVMTRVRGRQIRVTLGRYPKIKLQKARELAREKIHQAARGEDPRGAKRPAETVPGTFAATAKEFTERHGAGERWKKETARILEKDVVPRWGTRRPEEITRTEIVELLDEIADRGATIQANRTASVISRFFNWMLDRGVIETSPAVRLPKPGTETKRERILSDEEIRKLWPVWERMGWPFGWIFQFLLVTAQRRGQAAGLKWSEFDFERKAWTSPTKAQHLHEIPLSTLALQIIGRVERCEGAKLLFSTTGETAASGFSKAVFDATQKSGVDGWSPHDLRRTAATGMARLGVSKETIARVLDHAEGGVTGPVYIRAQYLGEKREALERWSRHLSKILRAKTADAPN
jgi:integrase